MTDARDLAARLASLLRSERHAMVEFLVALADFDDRKVWMRLGHASLFTFLHRDLGLSKGASHFRKVAAELIQRYPGWSSRCGTAGYASRASSSWRGSSRPRTGPLCWRGSSTRRSMRRRRSPRRSGRLSRCRTGRS